MLNELQNPSTLAAIILAVVAVQILLAVFIAVSLFVAGRERAKLHIEMFGLLKKLEGLTASRREAMLKQYNKMVETLSVRLPPTIASQTGSLIFEAESKILGRLAELEPQIKADDISKRKMDELIKTMENLEQTLVTLTSDTVKKVMAESKSNFFDDALDDASLTM